MNVLFLTLCEYNSIFERDIYTDLLRVFMSHGDKVYLISPIERRHKKESFVIQEGTSTILRLKIGNTQKTNIIEKGISTVLMEQTFIRGIKKYFSNIKFDLVIYSTPPITLVGAVEYVKERDNARTYLLLKDIFPQNAVDIGILSKEGLKGILYKYFRKKEKRLYRVSDRIGCMSPANVKYVLEHNSEIASSVVEECPNSVEIIDKSVDVQLRRKIREKYNIPVNKKVFVYGGNLGKPQGIPFLIECLKAVSSVDEAFFLIVGDGTEYNLLENYANSANQKNLMIMKRLPKEDYDTMVGACDVGMIFLDHRFTIPNFPSRLISYMQAKLPVLACTDPNTDIGNTIIEGNFGWWCESNSTSEFHSCVDKALSCDFEMLKMNSWEKLNQLYAVDDSYEIIIKGL